MTENWKDIPGFEGHYKVSDLGHVLSLKGGRKKLLSLVLDPSSGYLIVCLRKDEKQRNFSVHRLVATAFIRIPERGEHVCHNDGNPMNNTLGNLRIDTPLANAQDMTLHGTRAIGERHGGAKLTSHVVIEIRRLKAGGTTRKEISSLTGTTVSAIKDVLSGRTWSHV